MEIIKKNKEPLYINLSARYKVMSIQLEAPGTFYQIPFSIHRINQDFKFGNEYVPVIIYLPVFIYTQLDDYVFLKVKKCISLPIPCFALFHVRHE